MTTKWTGALRSATLALSAGLVSAGCGAADGAGFDEEEALGSDSSALSVTANQSLLITMTSVTRNAARTVDPCSSVAGDENKVWSMGHLLKREAEKNGIVPSAYVSSWMNAWTTTWLSQGQAISSIVGPVVRESWKNAAQGDTSMPLHKAPFYLLAIVNRPDLRKHRPGGEPLGGEVRFVFGMLSPPETNQPCPTVHHDGASTVIFEYSPAKVDDANESAENKIHEFASRWLALSTMSGSTYRSALEALTEEVVNEGRLLRIRTNELTAPGRWDFAEFEPHPTTKLIQRSTIKQSPTMALAPNGSQLMSDWIWQYRGDLYANAFDYEIGRIGSRAVTDWPIGSYSVPDTFPGTQTIFRGIKNSASSASEFWGGPTPTGVTSAQLAEWSDARFRFSVGTCRGCHSGDTGTSLLHIVPSSPGTEATRSAFLSGPVSVPDPAGSGVIRQFSEMFRRENDLRALVDEVPVLVPVLGNNYTVRFHASGKCLDSAGNGLGNGVFSQLYSCHGRGNQRLSLVSAGPNLYSLKYKHSGKCIDVQNASGSQNASTANNARVVQNACNGARTSQKLSLSVLSGAPIGTPAPRLLKFQHSNRCLLVKDQATADGTQIVQATCPASNDFAKGFNLVE